MQTKRYAMDRENTLAAGAVEVVEILNSAERKANYHGIRWQGSLRADNASADNEAHGLLVLTCQSNIFGDQAEGAFDSDSDLENQSGVIVAVEPWSVFGGSTNPVGGNTFHAWNIVLGTSRTCSKNDKLMAHIVSFAESAKNVVIEISLLSAFETVT